MLSPEMPEPKKYEPCAMITPFTTLEIKNAANRLKNGKSCGIDDLNAEYIKYAPEIIHETTADILNETAKTGKGPEELETGILAPLQKPGKPKGPRDSLRPIILLSVIRKILTICLIDRTWERLKNKIPIDQAAYQSGRSTTEQVFAVKLLAEKAITSSNYKLYLLLLDMSKAFDTVNRNILFTHLENILNPDELHLFSIITSKPKLQVKICKTMGEKFETSIGIMQGDCLSAIVFIYYLTCCLQNN